MRRDAVRCAVGISFSAFAHTASRIPTFFHPVFAYKASQGRDIPSAHLARKASRARHSLGCFGHPAQGFEGVRQNTSPCILRFITSREAFPSRILRPAAFGKTHPSRILRFSIFHREFFDSTTGLEFLNSLNVPDSFSIVPRGFPTHQWLGNGGIRFQMYCNCCA